MCDPIHVTVLNSTLLQSIQLWKCNPIQWHIPNRLLLQSNPPLPLPQHSGVARGDIYVRAASVYPIIIAERIVNFGKFTNLYPPLCICMYFIVWELEITYIAVHVHCEQSQSRVLLVKWKTDNTLSCVCYSTLLVKKTQFSTKKRSRGHP